MSILEDFFFAQTSEGRGSKVETLPSGENLGQIDDLRYFNNKMLRALGVPSAYLPSGPDDGSNPYNDGRVGTAFIQEFRFSRTCQRYQRLIVPTLDREFKLYLKKKGIAIDSSIFELTFNEPQNFSEYRQLELDNARANLYSTVAGIEQLSRRFALKRYLGLSDDDLAENERLWRQEQGVKHVTEDETATETFRPSDIRPPPTPDLGFDLGDTEFDEPDVPGEDAEADVGGDEGGEPPAGE